MGQQTPLYESCVKAGGKMVDFHGWDMPLHFGSQINEHHAVRKNAGIFDVSHMTIVDVQGPGARDYLRHLVPNDVDRLKLPGKALYTCMLNEDGGVLDDLIIYFLEDNYYRLVVNSATHDKDLAWLRKQANEYAVEIVERPNLAMLAIQGPQAIKLATEIMPKEQARAALQLKPFFGIQAGDWFIGRTGYTGEDGIEVMLPPEDAIKFFAQLIQHGVQPCGLGARDTLRLEAGLNLYGDDMDETVTPLESNVAWTIAWEPKTRAFNGREVLEAQKAKGVKRILVGLVLKDRGVLRAGEKVFTAEGEEGIITSGGFSPTLQRGIALARVPANIGDHCEIEIRGKRLAAQVIKPPFVRGGKANFVISN